MAWNFLRSLLATSPRRPIIRPRFRPAVELLESRRVLSSYSVNTAGDMGDFDLDDGVADSDPDKPGLQTTFEAAIDQAEHDGGGTINLDISVSADHGFVLDVPLTIDGQNNSLTCSDLEMAAGSTLQNVTLTASLGMGDGSKMDKVQVVGYGTRLGANSTATDCQVDDLGIGAGSTVSGVSGQAIEAAAPGGAAVTVANSQFDDYLDIRGCRAIVTGCTLGSVILMGAGGVQFSGNKVNITGFTGPSVLEKFEGGGATVSGNYFARGTLLMGAGNTFSGNTTLDLDVQGPGAKITGNKIAVNADGTALLPVSRGVRAGLFVEQGGALVQGNVIAAACSTEGGNTKVLDNKIGTNAAGTRALDGIGIALYGSNNVLLGNVLAGGTFISGDKNRVQGNMMGVNAAGTRSVVVSGTGSSGLFVEGDGNMIGGTASAARNVIAGFDDMGIEAVGDNNKVQGNYVGTNAAGTAAIPNQGGGVSVYGTANIIGGTTAAARNLISGNEFDGVLVGGINTKVEGNFIGTDKTGKSITSGRKPMGNHRDGVRVTGSGNTIGGTKDGAGNVICGNSGDGVHVEGDSAAKNVIAGNFIGTNEDGTDDLGNRGNGVAVIDAPGNTIGGSDENAGNVIGGSGNTDGTAGSVAAKLRRAATALHSVNNGIFVFGGKAINNKVQGDFIGITQDGKLENNKGDGVRLEGASKVTIGGTSKDVRNVISANKLAGVHILNGTGGNATHNLVQGNWIGTDQHGEVKLPDKGFWPFRNNEGVLIDNADDNTIGVDKPVTRNNGGKLPDTMSNIIAGNATDGVIVLRTATGNRISQNQIFANQLMGIDLNADRITAPDSRKSKGPNNWQNYPVLTSVEDHGGRTYIRGTVSAAAGQTELWVEFYVNPNRNASGLSEGYQLLGAHEFKVSGDTATINFSFPTKAVGTDLKQNKRPVLDHFITAIAIDPKGNTSEFSPCRDLLRNAVVRGAAGATIIAFFPANKIFGTELSLGAAARDCGYDHFNWYQQITAAPGHFFKVNPRIGKPTPLLFPVDDPVEDFPAFHVELIGAHPISQAFDDLGRPTTDAYPYYWDEDGQAKKSLYSLANKTEGGNILQYDDTPQIRADFVGDLAFRTQLVAVSRNTATYTIWKGLNSNFVWKSDKKLKLPGGKVKDIEYKDD